MVPPKTRSSVPPSRQNLGRKTATAATPTATPAPQPTTQAQEVDDAQNGLTEREKNLRQQHRLEQIRLGIAAGRAKKKITKVPEELPSGTPLPPHPKARPMTTSTQAPVWKAGMSGKQILMKMNADFEKKEAAEKARQEAGKKGLKAAEGQETEADEEEAKVDEEGAEADKGKHQKEHEKEHEGEDVADPDDVHSDDDEDLFSYSYNNKDAGKAMMTAAPKPLAKPKAGATRDAVVRKTNQKTAKGVVRGKRARSPEWAHRTDLDDLTVKEKNRLYRCWVPTDWQDKIRADNDDHLVGPKLPEISATVANFTDRQVQLFKEWILFTNITMEPDRKGELQEVRRDPWQWALKVKGWENPPEESPPSENVSEIEDDEDDEDGADDEGDEPKTKRQKRNPRRAAKSNNTETQETKPPGRKGRSGGTPDMPVRDIEDVDPALTRRHRKMKTEGKEVVKDMGAGATKKVAIDVVSDDSDLSDPPESPILDDQGKEQQDRLAKK
jgi:hypothetical protein